MAEAVAQSSPASSDEAVSELMRYGAAAAGPAVTAASTDSGDYELLAAGEWRRSLKRSQGVADKDWVMMETRRVLESLLRRSGEGRGGEREGECVWQLRRDELEHQYDVVGEERDQLPTPYQQMGSEESIFERLGGEAFKRMSVEAAAGEEESDYVDCQALAETVRKAAQSAKGLKSLRMLARPSSSKEHQPGKVKGRKVVTGGKDEESSSSTEDYEYTDNELLNRKKKSFFKLVSERLQQNFRRQVKPSGPPALLNRPVSTEEAPQGSSEVISKMDIPLPDVPSSLETTLEIRYQGSSGKSSSTPSDVGGALAGERLAGNSVFYADSLELASSCVPVISASPARRVTEEQPGSGLSRSRVTAVAEARVRRSAVTAELGGACEARLSGAEEKGGGTKERGVFKDLLSHFRRSSTKFRRRSSSSNGNDRTRGKRGHKDRSRSVENLRVHRAASAAAASAAGSADRTTARHSEYESAYCTTRRVQNVRPRSGVPSLPPPPPRDCAGDGAPERHSMKLDGLVSCVPDLPAPSTHQRAITRTVKKDSTDGKRGAVVEVGRALIYSSSKSFPDKSALEKEELYERIAEQLSVIADRYNVESPVSSKSSSPSSSQLPPNPTADASTLCSKLQTGCSKSGQTPPLSSSSAVSESCSANPGAASCEEACPTDLMAELIHNTSYGHFEQMVTSSVPPVAPGAGRGGGEVGWAQIARMFRLTQSAVQMAGMGTAVAMEIKEMSLRYFEDRFADWIVDQGGWESMVEETNSELD